MGEKGQRGDEGSKGSVGKVVAARDIKQAKAREHADKLALVRRAGEAIREDLAANLICRIGEEVTLAELQDATEVLPKILLNYFLMLLPEVTVQAFVKVDKERATFLLRVRGDIEITIRPGDDDPEFVEP